MSFKVKEIAEAWLIAHKPNERQKELAQLRYNICCECPFLNTILNVEVCGKCGCPAAKKIFTNKYDACPEHKWKLIESDYFHLPEENSENKKSRLI